MANKTKKKSAKNGTRKVLRVIISIIYILWGLWSPLSALAAILALNIPAIVVASVGVLTLLAGVLALLGVERKKCKAFGVVILVFSIASAVFSLPAISTNSIINALLAWLFIWCI